MEKNKNISVCVIKTPKVPVLAVTISWKCPDANWYTLHEAKEAYKKHEEQFKEGGHCVLICYAIFKRILERRSTLFDAKSLMDCMCCNINNEYFQISYSTVNKLSALKKTVKLIMQDLNPNSVFKQYSIAMRNLGGKVNREEFNWGVNEVMKSLKSEINIVVAGNIKLTSTKDGKKVSEKDNIKMLASYYIRALPDFDLGIIGKKVKPSITKHTIPDEKEHFVIKSSSPIEAALASVYINKSTGIRADALDNTIVVWHKSPQAKLKSVKKIDKIKQLFNKKNPVEQTAYHLLRCNCVAAILIKKFVDKNPTVDDMAQAVKKIL